MNAAERALDVMSRAEIKVRMARDEIDHMMLRATELLPADAREEFVSAYLEAVGLLVSIRHDVEETLGDVVQCTEAPPRPPHGSELTVIPGGKS